RHREAHAPEAHEVELGIVGNDAEVAQVRLARSSDQTRGTVCGRRQRTQLATISRVRVNAVKTVVRMPMPSVTAKPRTAPVPMKVVMLESRMVASARVNPASIAEIAERPLRASSRMRS